MNRADILRQLKDLVFAKQSVLGQIYEQHGQDSLFAYANNWQVAGTKVRQPFLDILKRQLQAEYGQEMAADPLSQFEQAPLVSTIDHHGLLNHPFFLNSNLVFGLHRRQKYLICLSTAGVSLNNSSWPASLMVTDKNSGRVKRFSFFPDKLKTTAVLAAPKIGERNVQDLLRRIGSDPDLAATEKDLLCRDLAEIFLDKKILSLPDFSLQASAASTRLWSKIFPDAPTVLYVPVEGLVSQILIQEVGQDANSLLYGLLFTSKGHDLVEKHFQGSLGAFSAAHKGSFLFWGMNGKGRRVHLHRDGKKLADGEFSIELNSKAVTEALYAQKIYPTSLVCFLVLLYYGITCLGGFNQVNWLTDIKSRFAALLKELGESQTADEVSGMPTNNFAEGNLAFLRRGNGLAKATGIDILLSQDQSLFEKYRQLARLLTVGESIESLLPEIYRVITPGNQQQDKLLAMSDEDIIAQNGAKKKIMDILA